MDFHISNNPNIPTGWQCPRCQRINAPHVDHCDCTGAQPQAVPAPQPLPPRLPDTIPYSPTTVPFTPYPTIIPFVPSEPRPPFIVTVGSTSPIPYTITWSKVGDEDGVSIPSVWQ
jgi:hypothetical protein